MSSVPLFPAKAREGAGAWLLLRRCTVAVVVPLVPAKAREGAGAWPLLRILVGTVTVVATALLRRGPRDIIAGVAAATAV